ncbi:MAG: ABC transporter substrate-binding protein [Alphaproteobacteria bacterium]
MLPRIFLRFGPSITQRLVHALGVPLVALAGAVFASAVFAVLCAGPVHAQEASPKAVVEGFYTALVQVMKQGPQLGYQGRHAKLDPVIDKAFHLAVMGRIAIGPQWNQLNPEQQQRAIDAFHRFTVANYAAQFSSFSGEKFEVEKESGATNDNIMVETRLVLSDGDSFRLNYLMRKYERGWRIVDVYLDGTASEVVRRRSEFSSVLSRQGIDGLIRMIDQRIEALSKG